MKETKLVPIPVKIVQDWTTQLRTETVSLPTRSRECPLPGTLEEGLGDPFERTSRLGPT